MGINGINNYVGFQNYKIPAVSNVNVKEETNQGIQPKEANLSINESIHEAPVVAKSKTDAALEDISVTFNKQESFDYIGQDSDIYSLDMEKAISDMKKDQVLQQYNYFVGNIAGPIVDNEDGMVFPKF